MLLYSCVEMGRALWAKPMERMSALGAQMLAPPSLLSGMPGAHETHAFLALAGRISKSYGKPEWGIHSALDGAGRERSVEIKVLLSEPFGRLIHFEKLGASEQPKLLIVAPMSGHYPTLLRDTVRHLLPSHDVYLTEWINARDVPISAGEFSLDDYARYLIKFLNHLALDGRRAHMLSVCQPTVPALGAQSLMAARGEPGLAKSMIMIGGPIDARKSPTAVTNFALEHDLGWFERNLISMVPLPYAGAGRLVYPGFLQHMGFVAMNPRRHATAHQNFFESLMAGDESSAAKHREFYDEYNAVMDLPKSYYLQTIKAVFQDFDLARGRLTLDGELVRPERIKDSALLSIEGELDDISGAGQTHAAQTLCAGLPESKKQAWIAPGVGHYGVFAGTRFGSEIAPRIAAFTRAHEKSGRAKK